MSPKSKNGDVVVAVNAKWVSWAHTVVAYSAFIGAFIVGVSLHYRKIVQNEYYGYPDEWFPSVSATIGDRYPERSVFMVFIAITSGPRFALCALWYFLTRRPGSNLPAIIAGIGIFRTFTCGGWTYVTSTDDHDWHDIFMISYLVATLPWTLGCLALSPPNPQAIRYRKILASLFFGTLVPLIYFFIQHKVHKIAGAYTIYAFFEWALILFDVAFDAVTALDFSTFELVVRDVKGLSRGNGKLIKDDIKKKARDDPLAQLSTFDAPNYWPALLDAAADIYSGYVFWSILTSLGICIWYFPLWHMGISGYEIFVMAPAAPLWLAIPPLRSLVIKNIRVVQFASLAGLLAYLVHDPVWRLFIGAFATSIGSIGWTATWYAERANPQRLQARILAWSIGLILSSISKFANHTNNPIWPILHAANGGWNKTGFALAILALWQSTRPITTSGGRFPPATTAKKGSSLLAAFGIAGIIYANWTGYYGALILAIYVMALTPILISSATYHNPGISFGVGLLLYNFLVLFHVWVVAYAFVPGGPLVREHTDWVMITTMLMIGAGVFSSQQSDSPYKTSAKSSAKTKPPRRSAAAYYFHILAVLQLLSFSIAFLRFPTNDYTPYHPDQKLITAGIWTIHFSLDNDMWSSERRMRDAIKELELDVVGLLESDLQRIIMGNRDTTQYLAEDLGMYVDYGPGPNKHTWGSALLSKFPIVNSTHHLLPSPVGELAPAIEATIDAYGTLVDVFVFHSGQEEDPEDRRLQSEYLAARMGATNRPTILLSYLVVKPGEGNYNTYVGEKSGMHDIDVTDDDRWCEYILYKNIKRIGYARVARGTITDTEIQVGKFLIGPPATYDGERRPEESVPPEYRFPEIFKGQGCSSSTHLHLHRQTHLVENVAVRLKPTKATRSPEPVTVTDEIEVLSLGTPGKGKLETLLHTGKQKIRRNKLQIAPKADSNLSSFFAGKRSSQRSASSGDSGYESMDRPDPVADLLGMKAKEVMAKTSSGDPCPRRSPIIIRHNVAKRSRDQDADVAAQSAFFVRRRSDEISKFKKFSKKMDEKSLLKTAVVMPAVVKVQNERPPAHYAAMGGWAKQTQKGISTAIAAMNSAMSSTDDVLCDLVSPTSFRSRMESSRQSGASMSEGELSFIGVKAPSLYSVQSRDPEVDSIAECLAHNVIKRYINFQSQCTSRCRPASSQDSNSSHSTPLTSARHTPATSVSSTSKRSRGKDDPNQPNDDDTGRRDSSFKRSRVDVPSEIKLFACPYSKFDPSRFSELNLVEKEYRRCSCCYLRDIPRLKQHLYRVHRRPEYYCGSCFESFKARELLDGHMRQRPACELRSPKFEEKMTDEQFSAIKRRIVKGDPCELWFNIFKTLFPTAPKPLSPYARDNDVVAVNHFVALFRWFGPEELLNLLRDRRNRDRHAEDSSPLEPSTQAIVDEAFEIALPEYLSLFRGREEEAKPATTRCRSLLRIPIHS
ncbi:hypothetical protein DV736_g2533, partial [Chaetothyriales sp. CBS 134916]